MSDVRAGILRHRVTIQYRVETRGDTGEVLWTWTDFARVWAAIEPVTGRESWAGAQLYAEVTTLIRVRYREGITPKMRIFHGDNYGSPTFGEYFDVQSVVRPDYARDELQLYCVKRDASGWRDNG